MLDKVEAGNHALSPTTITMNAVLYSFAKSEKKDAGKLAEIFLNKMVEMQHTLGGETLKPNTISYTTVSNFLSISLKHWKRSIMICISHLYFGGY